MIGAMKRIPLPGAVAYNASTGYYEPASSIPPPQRLMDAMIRILIVDDHAVVREGLRMLLADTPDLEIVGEAADGAAGVAAAAALQPDVVLLDLVMPHLNGIDAIGQITARAPGCHILVLTSFSEDQNVRAAIQAGATGYLLKDVLKPDLLRAIRDAAQGKPTLHPEVQQRLMRHIASPPLPEPHADLTE